MAIKRYARANILGINKQYGTSRSVQVIRKGLASKIIRFTTEILKEGQRLDSIAGIVYGDAQLYWIIAAASNIGWTMQVPPSTILIIPNLSDVAELIG